MEPLPMEYFKNTEKPRVVSNLGFRFADTKQNTFNLFLAFLRKTELGRHE